MGFTKRMYEEELERGFARTGKQICRECVADQALQAVVDEELAEDPCSYCGAAESAPLDAVIAHMLMALRFEYRPASEESPPWDGAEGGYQARDYWLPDLIFDHLSDDLPEATYDDIRDAVVAYDEPWFDRDVFALRPHQQMLLSWDRFARIASRRPEDELRPRARRAQDPDAWINTDHVLDAIADALAELPDAFRIIETGSLVWRARSDEHGPVRLTAAGLGPPSHDAPVRAGRMNRPNQVRFYGASELDTALLEVFRFHKNVSLWVGEWTTLRPLTLLDLTASRLAAPSIYDLGRQAGRVTARFLEEFGQAIARPVISRTNDPASYRPSQLLTEYARTELETRIGVRPDGIAYPSSRAPGANIAIFISADACTDLLKPGPGHVLRLDMERVQQVSHTDARRRWQRTRHR